MTKQAYAAFDLGAESGRAMLGVLDNKLLDLQAVHRFANRPQYLPSGYHWNVQSLWANIVEGLGHCTAAAKKQNMAIESIGVDTWGVDFALISRSGQLLGLPFTYRDARCGPAYEKVLNTLGKKAIYDATGIQLMAINSLYQLVAQQQSEPDILDHAGRLLMMGDLMHFLATGEPVNESTCASTTQMVDPCSGTWAFSLLEQLSLPTHLLGKIVQPGTILGPLRKPVAEEAGCKQLPVIVPGTHDTASAVAAVPVDDETFARGTWTYLSSGTWSLMGAELNEPVISNEARSLGFTNERGVENKIRFLKNIAGLWLVQQCRSDLARTGETFDYTQLTQLAEGTEAFRTLVDPNSQPFSEPGNIRAKICTFARTTNQPEPLTPGQFIRCCLESLALCYRQTMDNLETILDRTFDVLHIVGGGGQNQLLNQLTCDAIGRPVVIGPYEATAIGNVLMQAIGAGHIANLQQARHIVRNSFTMKTIKPKEPDRFDAQFNRFTKLLGHSA